VLKVFKIRPEGKQSLPPPHMTCLRQKETAEIRQVEDTEREVKKANFFQHLHFACDPPTDIRDTSLFSH
jgi:hypothetical protein